MLLRFIVELLFLFIVEFLFISPELPPLFETLPFLFKLFVGRVTGFCNLEFVFVDIVEEFLVMLEVFLEMVLLFLIVELFVAFPLEMVLP